MHAVMHRVESQAFTRALGPEGLVHPGVAAHWC
jgi:hypothetical protein